jgi:hypothetical protein
VNRKIFVLIAWVIAMPLLGFSILVAIISHLLSVGKRKKFTNCIVFVMSKWLDEGGYIVLRKSRFGWWPHFLWARSLSEMEHLVPESKAPPKYGVDLLFFNGTIETEDKQ